MSAPDTSAPSSTPIFESSLADQIAQASIKLYETLPAHGKPALRNNGVSEWTILATICIVLTFPARPRIEDTTRIIPISLGTGVKVLPISRLPPLGDAVHDSHAEVLARRGFIRWLIHQGKLLTDASSANGESDSRLNEDILVERMQSGKLRLREGVDVWMYISTLPCGDASTLHTAVQQSEEEAAQWGSSTPPSQAPSSQEPTRNHSSSPTANTSETVKQVSQSVRAQGVIRGRNGYSTFSALRTKPGRPDSIPSISMSCSDKLASWSVLGLQGGLLARSFEPVYLDGIVIGGVETPSANTVSEEIRGWKEIIRTEVERAIWGRLEMIEPWIARPYALHRPSICLTSVPFSDSKSNVMTRMCSSISTDSMNGSMSPTMPTTSLNPSSTDFIEPAPSALSLSHLPFLPHPSHPKAKAKPDPNKAEILSNGSRISFGWKAPGTKAIKSQGRSRVCKLEIMRAYFELIETANEDRSKKVLPSALAPGQSSLSSRYRSKDDDSTITYYDLKHPPPSSESCPDPSALHGARMYQHVKTVLRGTPCRPQHPMKGFEPFPDVLSTASASEDVISASLNHPIEIEGSGLTIMGNDGLNPQNISSSSASQNAESGSRPPPPFIGWLVSGRPYEAFTAEGHHVTSSLGS